MHNLQFVHADVNAVDFVTCAFCHLAFFYYLFILLFVSTGEYWPCSVLVMNQSTNNLEICAFCLAGEGGHSQVY